MAGLSKTEIGFLEKELFLTGNVQIETGYVWINNFSSMFKKKNCFVWLVGIDGISTKTKIKWFYE